MEGLPDSPFLLFQRQQDEQTLMQQMVAPMQHRLMALLAYMTKSTGTSTVDSSLDNAIATSKYVPDENVIFETWYVEVILVSVTPTSASCCRWSNRNEDNFNIDTQKLDVVGRVRFLLRKFDAVAYERYADYVLSKRPRDLKFDEMITTLKDVFGPKISLLNQGYHRVIVVLSRTGETS
uniref:DUF7083 domain-containing protein n=1 Tax=Parascaris univalens TaxID=6257 RepID=A0A915A313_PARUN